MDPKPTETARRVIPKFSSFKPVKGESPPSPPAPPQSNDDRKKEGRRERREHWGRREHRKHDSKGRERGDSDKRRDSDERRRGRDRGSERDRREREGDQEHHYRRQRSRSCPKSTTLVGVEKARSPSPESWDTPQKQYYTDTRGDPSNVIYGTTYRYEIPDYCRYGSGCVVGLTPDIRIDADKGDGRGLVLVSKRDMIYSRDERKNSRYSYAKDEGEGVKMLRIKKGEECDDKAFEVGLDFVPISLKWKGKKRKGHPNSESEGSELEHNHYRSLEGLKKARTKPEDCDLEYASSTDSDKDLVSSWERNYQRRNAKLAKKAGTNPTDVNAWMEYVDHQDTILAGSGREPKLAERMSTAEVKLDILTKALEKCPGDETLLVKYMAVAEAIWDSKKLLSKWQQVLKDNPTITGIWIKYINFRQTDFQSFTYPECIKCFSECLAILRLAALRLDKDKGSVDKEKLEETILYVFLRTAVFMREAGYVEFAIATFQCMLELNIFNPLITPLSETEVTHEVLLSKLEEFWDSEVLRIGEPGAKGWASYVESGDNGDIPDTRKEDFFSEPLDPRDPFGSWINTEEEILRLSVMPARTVDEVEEYDPYRVVLFSDIKAFMFYFSVETVRKKIADAFLVFLGLTPAGPMSSESSQRTDTFLRNEIAAMEEWYLDEWFWPKSVEEVTDAKTISYHLEGMSMEPERKSGLSKGNSFEFGLRNFPIAEDSLFNSESGDWSKRVKRIDVGFVGRTLEMLVDGLKDENLAVYYLAWVSRNQPENVKRVTKTLLKRFRTSLRLWNGYAQAEWQDGKVDAARNIFATTLGMSQGFPEASRRDAILLWKTWAWKELGDQSQTIRILLSVESGKLLPEDRHNFSPKNINPALLLRARRYLDDQQNLMLSMGHIYHAVVYNEVRALLEYLSRDQDISVTISITDTLIDELKWRNLTGPQSVAHEFCLMAKTRLLYHHATTARMFKMKIMRDVLEQAVTSFPNNSVFMGLYAWNEGKTKIENRVRALLRDMVLKEGKETVIGWVFVIWAEMRVTGVGGGYNACAVRALFEQAVRCDRTKSNVGLWVIYVNFELRENEPRRAKETLSRGLQCCPWSKDLALLAFKKLRTALDFEEIRRILSIISSEKELRVHDTTELDDVIEEMAEAQREKLGGLGKPRFLHLSNDGSEDEGMED